MTSIPALPPQASAIAEAPVAPDRRWGVRLLGAVEAVRGAQTISHWPTRAIAALLARLAMAPDRAHPREELIELLWPGVSLVVGRNRLRQALSTLRGLLEPPGEDPGGARVLLADRMAIRALPGALDCDAQGFERMARCGDLARARSLYVGEFMPGFYDDWVIVERQRLAALFEHLEPGGDVTTTAMSSSARAMPSVQAMAGSDPDGLPSYWTRTFGVEMTASRLRALVCAQRLVTVHGPGGSGKTRLAVEVAQALRDAPEWAFEGGERPTRFDRIIFVPMIDCFGSAQALEVICGALRVDGSGDAHSRIVASLGGRRVLLVLDNVEQLVDAAGHAIARLLASARGLHVLATSRRLFELDGEHAFELEGLPLPEPDAAFDDITGNPSVGLFVDRARAAQSNYLLGERNADAIALLVRMLGGMPLAIELAASRMRGQTALQLSRRLREDAGSPMLDLLARGTQRATAESRHASMRHVVAWSWGQLSTAQSTLLQAMSVLSAPARLGAIAAAAAIAPEAALRQIEALRDASLVHSSEGSDEGMRYALLQPVREFAAERFGLAQAKAARQRLRHWLIEFAGDAVQRGPWAVVPEVALIHAAITSAPEDGALHDAVVLALILRPYWDTDSLPLSAVMVLEQAPAALGDTALRCDLLELLSLGRGTAGFIADAVTHAESALAVADDDRRRSLVLVRWVWAMYYAGRYDVGLDPALAEALHLARRAGDLVAQATVLRMQSLVACNFRLDFATAEDLSAQAQCLWERLGDRRRAYNSLVNRATMWAWQGRNAEAITVFDECHRAAKADNDWVAMMQIAWQRGRVLIRMRCGKDAVDAFRRSVSIGWHRHYAQGLANAMLHLPEALVMTGQATSAARLQGFAVTHWSRLYNAINRIEARELRRTRLLLHLHLGGARAEALRAEGSSMPVADAVRLALDDSGL